MPANDFLPFAAAGGANALDQPTYAALPGRSSGFASGVAISAWFNKVWRQSSSISAIIAQFLVDLSGQDALDDGNTGTLLDNYKRAYRTQKTNYITAGGSANAITLTPSPSVLSWAGIAGTPIRMRASLTNTIPGVTVSFTGVTGAKALKRRNHSDLFPADILSGMIFEFFYDEVADQCVLLGLGAAEVSQSVPFGTNPIIWVRTDGSDNNDGTVNDAAHAMQTINGAIARGTSLYNLSGKTLDVRLGIAGSYAPVSLTNGIPFTVTGDNANSAAYIIGPGTGPQQSVYIGGGSASFSGVTFAGVATANLVEAAYGGSIALTGTTRLSGTSGTHLVASGSAAISVGGTLNVAGSSSSLASGVTGGSVTFQNGTTVNMIGTPAFSIATVVANSGYIYASALGGGVTWVGSATGSRYQVVLNGVLQTFGAPTSIPGNAAGTTGTGGQAS